MKALEFYVKSTILLGAVALFGASLVPAVAMPVRHTAATTAATPIRTGFVSTNTLAFPLATLHGVDLGAAPDSTPLKIVVALTPRNTALIDTILRRQNTPGDAMYHRYFTAQQTVATFSPTAAQVQATAAYLQSNGYKNLVVSPDNMIVTAYGTVAMANAAFGAAEHVAQVGDQRILANTAPAAVPSSLRPSVTSVLGLNTMQAHTFIQRRANNQGCTVNPATGTCTLGLFGPRDFWYAYDTAGYPIQGRGFTADFRNGINTTIAIFAEGNLTQLAKDLRQFENRFQLPQTAYTFIYPSLPSTDVAGLDEWDLDTQSSSGMAGNVKRLDVYAADSLTDADTLISYEAFKNNVDANGNPIEKAASASYGECDTLAMVNGSLTVTDATFGQAAVQGQTIFASSGDGGPYCLTPANGANTGVMGASYPASSKYVVGVGGTSLFIKPDDTYQGEKAWENSGGNVSTVENAGYWAPAMPGPVMTTPTPPVALPVNNPLGAMRMVPDIAMDGDDLQSGAAIVFNGANFDGVGGTSLSSPLALGVWARLQSQNNNRFGFASPLLYQEFGSAYVAPGRPGTLTGNVAGFNDIQVGTQAGGFAASPGYDLVTGLGSIDIDRELTYLKTLP